MDDKKLKIYNEDEKKEYDIEINQLNYETLKKELNRKYNIDLDNYDLFNENGNKIDNNDLLKVKDRKINLKKKQNLENNNNNNETPGNNNIENNNETPGNNNSERNNETPGHNNIESNNETPGNDKNIDNNNSNNNKNENNNNNNETPGNYNIEDNNEIKNLNNIIENLKEECTKLRNEKEKLEINLKNVKEEYEKEQKQLFDTKIQIQKENENIEEKIKNIFENQKNKWEKEIEIKVKEAAKKQSNIDIITNELISLHEKYENEKNNLDSIISDKTKELTGLKAQLSKLQNDVNVNNFTVCKLNESIEELNNDYSKNKKNFDENKDKFDEEIKKKKEEIEFLNLKIKELKSLINNMNQKIKNNSLVYETQNKLKEGFLKSENINNNKTNIKDNIKNQIKNYLNKLEEDFLKKYKEVNNENFNSYIMKINELEEKRKNEFNEIKKKNEEITKQLLNTSKLNIIKHHNKKCEKCGKNPIEGILYKCSECKEYYLCEKCEDKNFFDKSHPHNFIKIRKSFKKYEIDSNNKISVKKNENRDNINCKYIIKKNIDFQIRNEKFFNTKLKSSLEIDNSNNDINNRNLMIKNKIFENLQFINEKQIQIKKEIKKDKNIKIVKCYNFFTNNNNLKIKETKKLNNYNNEIKFNLNKLDSQFIISLSIQRDYEKIKSINNKLLNKYNEQKSIVKINDLSFHGNKKYTDNFNVLNDYNNNNDENQFKINNVLDINSFENENQHNDRKTKQNNSNYSNGYFESFGFEKENYIQDLTKNYFYEYDKTNINNFNIKFTIKNKGKTKWGDKTYLKIRDNNYFYCNNYALKQLNSNETQEVNITLNTKDNNIHLGKELVFDFYCKEEKIGDLNFKI